MLNILDSGIDFHFGITRTHELAKELLKSDDNFVTVIVDDREYSIDRIKNIKTHANSDDDCIHKALVCNAMSGNIIR